MKDKAITNYLLDKESFFWTPDYLDISAWIEHIPFAFWIIESLKPKIVVELGVHNGVSYFAFCQAIKRLNIDSASYGIDTWKGDEHAGFYEEEVFGKVTDYNAREYFRFSTLIRSTFDEAKEYFIDGSIDLLHIDGLHTYEAVKHDFETWLPKLSTNSIVVFHDINVRERNFGVFKLWEELKQQYRHFQFDFGHGLGVLSIGSGPEEKLPDLFNDNRVERYFIFLRNIFSEHGKFFQAQLNNPVVRDFEKKNLEELRIAYAEAIDGHTKLESSYRQIYDNNRQREEESKSLAILNSQLEELHAARQIISIQNEQLENRIASLSKELKEKESISQDLQFNFSLTRQQLNEVNNKLLTIYDSDGWKLLNRYYTLKGKLLNENSKHYKLIKRAVNFFRGRKDNAVISSGPDIIGKKIEATLHKIKRDSKGEIIPQALPHFQKPEVSIIIPVYNAWEMNILCITAIIENTTDVAYEVIIADDCSTDTTKDIATYFPNIVHIRSEKNLGFLLNCNNAASYAKGKYIHFLNNDTEVKPGWLSSLVMLLNKDETIGLAGSKLIYPDGRLQEAGGIIWDDASGWNFGHSQNPEQPEFNYVKEVDYISGASIMIRTDLWNNIGGFDTDYSPAYCEDSDLAFKIREKGFKVMLQPLSEVTHYEGYSHGSDKEKSKISSIKEYQRVNNVKFFEKWKTVLQRDHFPNGENIFQARDRSRLKKTLLMVDHYVPQFDKDAGSRTTFQYLELFVKLGFNVKFIGENFYKDEPYTTVLQQMGVEVLYGYWYAANWKQWFIDNKEKFDYVYLNRPHVSINFIDFFKEHSTAKIIYYGHDLHFLRKEKKYELEKDETILAEAAKWKEIEMYLFSKSDIILTPSTNEQKIIQSLNSEFNVQLMRPYIYKTISAPVTDFQERKDLFFIGGFGHAPNVDGILWFVKESWPLIKPQVPGVKFIIAGSNPPKKIKDLADDDIIIKGYIGDDEMERLYATCKIAVIPLRYGAGVKGKTVEAMRYGIPLVTTSFGVEGLPGDYSFLKVADTSQLLANTIIDIYNDETVLSELSGKSIRYIQNNFTEEIATGIISKALATV